MKTSRKWAITRHSLCILCNLQMALLDHKMGYKNIIGQRGASCQLSEYFETQEHSSIAMSIAVIISSCPQPVYLVHLPKEGHRFSSAPQMPRGHACRTMKSREIRR